MRPARQKSKAPMIFAVVGVVVALAAIGLYVLRETTAPPQRTPVETVNEFLTGVFLSVSADRVAAVVCDGWEPTDAITRTSEEFPAGSHISWDDVAVVSESPTKVTVRARLGLRLQDETRPSSYGQWRFSLVAENGWRVCEARPFTA
jgi:hypothetical protein